MPGRFPKNTRSIQRRGRPKKIKWVNSIQYKDYNIEYELYELAKSYLVIIKSPSMNTPLEFLVDQESIQEWGVEKYIRSLILQLETSRNEVKEKMANYFLVDENSLTNEQVIAFSELLRREIF